MGILNSVYPKLTQPLHFHSHLIDLNLTTWPHNSLNSENSVTKRKKVIMDVKENEQSLPNLYQTEFIVPTHALN